MQKLLLLIASGIAGVLVLVLAITVIVRSTQPVSTPITNNPAVSAPVITASDAEKAGRDTLRDLYQPKKATNKVADPFVFADQSKTQPSR